MDTLFSRLGAIYGHIWWSAYQNEKVLAFARKEWSESLQRFDNRTLKDALLVFREKGNYPPTLPQFIECCKAIDKRKEALSAPKDRSTQFVRSTGEVEMAAKHIKAMLESLRR